MTMIMIMALLMTMMIVVNCDGDICEIGIKSLLNPQLKNSVKLTELKDDYEFFGGCYFQ